MNTSIESPYAVYKSIWRYLDAYNTPCRGDITRRIWDWPTLSVVFPRIAATLRQCQRQIIEDRRRREVL